ncbi:MAG: type III-B CRISPR module RAMP protein Cmr6 [Thermodesulfobacteriota bacterium]
MLQALAARQEAVADPSGWKKQAELTAPLLTGTGNPHPIENGFAFLLPYGIPYLAASGFKGVMRKAAEELAISGGSSPWTLFLVWVMFGFDETCPLLQPKDRVKGSMWEGVFERLIETIKNASDLILADWLKALDLDPPPVSQKAWIRSLRPQNADDRRPNIHWQGLLEFEDAFPDAQAQLDVDILNPHHSNYYQRGETPHDAEQPKPVFFLVLREGATFVFRIRRRHTNHALWRWIPDWNSLLDEAFNYACDWLGFGAKTATGYGAMKVTTPCNQ